MQKIKNFFKFITDKDLLIKIILIQIIFLLFIIISGELKINIDTSYGASLDVTLDGGITTYQ